MSLSTWWSNRKLGWRRGRLAKDYKRVEAEARRKKDRDIVEEWLSVHELESDVIDAGIKANKSQQLRDRADELNLPTPDLNDSTKWMSKEDLGINTVGNWWILTPEAMRELSLAIRKEEHERREVWESRVKIIGAVIRA